MNYDKIAALYRSSYKLATQCNTAACTAGSVVTASYLARLSRTWLGQGEDCVHAAHWSPCFPTGAHLQPGCLAPEAACLLGPLERLPSALHAGSLQQRQQG